MPAVFSDNMVLQKGVPIAILIRNVLAGDVWLASGQSNMEMPVRNAANAAQEMESANYPGIRLSV